jgi:phenylpropionate dioxygenase-like ring-hydroxylating dioxygenase large terminal subunit
MSASLDELLSRFDPNLPLERARTIPAAWYHEPALADAERRRVFGDSWVAVGRADQVAGPGSFFTLDLAGEPLVILRDDRGTLRGFFNVCRHRGARVACEEQGALTRLRCRYHGWTYDLQGRLRGTPEFDGVAEFAREANGLPPVTVAQWGPLVWAHLGDCPPPIEEWVAPLAARGFDAMMAPLHFAGRQEYRLACNWKVFVDNYLDGGYHINTVHLGLASVLDYSKYRTEIDRHASVQVAPMEKRSGGVGEVRTGEAAYYVWVFPNLMLNLYEGVMDTNLVLPDGPGHCRVIFDFYFADVSSEEAKAYNKRSMAVAHQVQLEDVGICEEVQRGLSSASYDTGRFSVKREAGGYHFHQLLARWLRGGRGAVA